MEPFRNWGSIVQSVLHKHRTEFIQNSKRISASIAVVGRMCRAPNMTRRYGNVLSARKIANEEFQLDNFISCHSISSEVILLTFH